MNDFKDRLSAANDAFQSASTDNMFELPPDGEYQARIDSFDWIDSSNGLLMKTVMTVVSPTEFEGRTIDTIHNVEKPDRMVSLKRHLIALDLDVENLALLENHLQMALDKIVDVSVKTSTRAKDDGTRYRNVYVNRVVGTTPNGYISGREPVSVASDDQITF